MTEIPSGTSVVLLIVYLALSVGPGMIVGAAGGVRGWALVAIAPLIGFGLVGALGSVLPLFGVRWSPWWLVSGGAVIAAVVAAARLAYAGLRRARPDRDGTRVGWDRLQQATVAAAVLLAGSIGVLATAAATRDFTAVPQIWDSVYHGNATHYIAETGESSPAALRALNEPDVADYFYPNGYHVTAASFVMLTGAPVTSALELSFAVVPLQLAAGVVAMVRALDGRAALAASAALLSCAFTAFPYDLLPWGTLLPFLTAVALLPAFLAVWMQVLRSGGTAVGPAVALALAGVGILALHPSVAVAAVVLGGAYLLQSWITRGPRTTDAKVVGAVALGIAAFGAPLILASARAAAGPAYDWPATTTPAVALGEVLLQSHAQQYPQWWLALLTIIGLASLQTHRSVVWIAVSGLLFAGLFMLAASYEGAVVELLTRPWWNDRWRFAALWTLCAIPVAAVGLVVVRDGLLAIGRSALRRVGTEVGDRGRRSATATVTVSVVALVVLLTDGLYLQRNMDRLAQAFANGPTVSEAEERAFDVLADLVPENSVVMNDPYDGSAWMWALTGVRPLFATPVIAGHELPIMEPNRRVLFESFNRIDRDPAVRRVVDQLGIQYVILCDGFIAPAGEHVPGMQDLDSVQSLEPVFENSDAVIYRIVGPPVITRG